MDLRGIQLLDERVERRITGLRAPGDPTDRMDVTLMGELSDLAGVGGQIR